MSTRKPASTYRVSQITEGSLIYAVVTLLLPATPGFAACGEPAFSEPAAYTAGTNPKEIAVADLNEDGWRDMIVTHVGAYSGDGVPDTIAVFIGSGNGRFLEAVYYQVGNEPISPVAADFNEDGHVDIAVNNSWSASVMLFLGNGDGTLAAPSEIPVAPNPLEMITEDFNADGHADLAISHFFSGTVGIFLGTGHGGFESPVYWPVGSNATRLAPGDFNGDGVIDIVVSNYFDTVTLLLGTGNAGFAAPQTIPAGEGEVYYVSSADLNQDRALDLIVSSVDTGSVNILIGTGTGDFSAPVLHPVGNRPTVTAIGDIDGNGLVDVAVGLGEDAVGILMGDGLGGFASPAFKLPAGVYHEGVELADLNNDGRLDLAATEFFLNRVWVFLNNSNTPPLLQTEPLVSFPCSPPQGRSITLSTTVTDPDADSIDILLIQNGVVLDTIHKQGPLADAIVEFTLFLEPGNHAFTIEVSDGCAHPSLEVVAVVEAEVDPPVITGLKTAPEVLWPANRRMVPIRVDFEAADACGVDSVNLTVTSSEPDIGPGFGNLADDIVLVPGNPHLVYLRAERFTPAKGRTYTIGVEATDATGNRGFATTVVTVPVRRPAP